MIADARLVIADEPTPGMSVEQAVEALKIFREMAEEGKSIVLITHDIDLAFAFADRIAVFYAGTVVETASAQDFQAGPCALRHPYSKALWRALPQMILSRQRASSPTQGICQKGVSLRQDAAAGRQSANRRHRHCGRCGMGKCGAFMQSSGDAVNNISSTVLPK